MGKTSEKAGSEVKKKKKTAKKSAVKKSAAKKAPKKVSKSKKTTKKSAKKVSKPKKTAKKSAVKKSSAKKAPKKVSKSKKPAKKTGSKPKFSPEAGQSSADILETPDVESLVDTNLQKLISPEDQEAMGKNLDKIARYLDDIGIQDMTIDRKKFIIIIPFEYDEFSFLSHCVVSTDWALIKTSIFELGDYSEKSVFSLFAELLKGNFILNSVVYSLDPENKSVWAQCDIPIDADFEIFKLNYFSIIFAIDYFLKSISPKLNMNLKSTYSAPPESESPSGLYI